MRPLGSRRVRNVIAKPAPPRLAQADGAASVEATSRAVDELAARVGELADSTSAVYVADVDLAVGDNVIPHGLNRRPGLVLVLPKEADASFAWGWDPDQPGNATPAKVTIVAAVGVPMRARVWVE